MRTLGAILDLVKRGDRPEYDELRYAVRALESLSTFDHMAFGNLAEAERENKPRVLSRSAVFQHEEQFNRWHRALNADPRVWLGPDNDLDDPATAARYEGALRLFDRVEKGRA